MNNLFKENLYPIIVFITGACILIIEVVAVRALSPFFGNTLFTVSSVISVILAALSFGYYYGGQYADKNPRPEVFFKIIMLSGAIQLFLFNLGFLILPLITLSFGIAQGPFVATLALYFIPALLLGTLSPFAVKLHSIQNSDKGIGELTGKMFFFSTIGSISGSLMAGFLLIPNFGVNTIFITTSLVLFLLGLIPLYLLKKESELIKRMEISVFILTLMSLALVKTTNDSTVYSKDGIYEKITIVDSTFKGRPIRSLQQDRSSSGAMYLDTNDPTDSPHEYPKYFALYKLFTPNPKKIFVIGGGPYSIPKALAYELPNAEITVSEIEPSLYELAQKYFELDTKNIINIVEDGRRVLTKSEQKYDFIFSDVYYSLYSIPSHVTTKEFFELAKLRLNEDGIFVANIIGNIKGEGSDLFKAELKTFLSVFPNSYLFAANHPNLNSAQNIIFVGYNSGKKVNFDNLQNSNNILAKLKEKQVDLSKINLDDAILLTDNYAPTDSLGAKMIKESFKNN